MSIISVPDSPPAVVPPNAHLPGELRKLADWLEANPQLPAVNVFLHGRPPVGNPTAVRAALADFAESLPGPAVEEVEDFSLRVQIVHHPAERVRVVMGAALSEVNGRAVAPRIEYEPILPDRS